MHKTLSLCFALSLSLAAPMARGQHRPVTAAFSSSTTDWAVLSQHVAANDDVVVVDRARPRSRRKCLVQEVRPDGLLCLGRHATTSVFSQGDILAVLSPQNLHEAHLVQLWGGAGLCLLSLGFLTGPAAPVFLVAGGLLLLTWPAAAMGDNGDVNHDTVLYYAPGPRPQLPLR